MGWFNFSPACDEFKESPIDLRALLNEQEAGEHGFITVHGDQFVHGDNGQPVRFWAVNAGPDLVRLAPKQVDRLARMLARKGVNLVRIHGPIYTTRGPTAGQVDYAYLDKLHYFVTALKREGIYALISIYFQHWLQINELPQFPALGHARAGESAVPRLHRGDEALCDPFLQSGLSSHVPLLAESAAEHDQPLHRAAAVR